MIPPAATSWAPVSTFFGIPVTLTLITITLTSIAICWKVYRTQKKSQKRAASPSMVLYRRVLRQSLCFVLAFYVTLPFPLLSNYLSYSTSNHFWILVVTATLAPSQGLMNSLAYFQRSKRSSREILASALFLAQARTMTGQISRMIPGNHGTFGASNPNGQHGKRGRTAKNDEAKTNEGDAVAGKVLASGQDGHLHNEDGGHDLRVDDALGTSFPPSPPPTPSPDWATSKLPAVQGTVRSNRSSTIKDVSVTEDFLDDRLNNPREDEEAIARFMRKLSNDDVENGDSLVDVPPGSQKTERPVNSPTAFRRLSTTFKKMQDRFSLSPSALRRQGSLEPTEELNREESALVEHWRIIVDFHESKLEISDLKEEGSDAPPPPTSSEFIRGVSDTSFLSWAASKLPWLSQGKALDIPPEIEASPTIPRGKRDSSISSREIEASPIIGRKKNKTDLLEFSEEFEATNDEHRLRYTKTI